MNKRTNNKDFARRATMTLLMCMPPLGGREHWKRSKTLPRPFEGLEAFQSAKRGRLKVSEALQSAKRMNLDAVVIN